MTIHSLSFSLLLLVSSLFCLWNLYKRFRLVMLGKNENRVFPVSERIKAMFVYAFAQKRVVKKVFGINHFVIFWAFMILTLANTEFILKGIFPALSLELLPASIHHVLLLSFDLVSLLALLGVSAAAARRLFFKPKYLDSSYVKGRSWEAFLILGFIFSLMTAYFGIQGIQILSSQAIESWLPISSVVAGLFRSLYGQGLDPATVSAWGCFFWWLHAAVLLAFICFLPLSKHMHIFTAIPNCYFQSLKQPLLLPREEFKSGNVYGVSRVDQFTWKDLFDAFTCTECGRCQDACPATATGKSLNPRQIIHAIKTNLLANGDNLLQGQKPVLPLINGEGEGSNTEETIWACTTCGACLESCPVLIEQMPKILQLRRFLVQMESKFPEELLNLFENMEARSNPWGIAPGDRAKWTSTLEVKPFVAGQTEYLFYVGCAGSFDSRQKQVTVSLAYLLNQAGVSWGILGKDEKCCGDSLRRLGNEFVFEKMAKENVKLFMDSGVKKIITLCPHCFSTIKNDYSQYGLEIEVLHHSQFIQDLIASGRLKINHQVKNLGKIVFHDSCYLGRHNQIYDSPRKVIQSVTGDKPLEMKRNRNNAFCCGAGGGRMWMEENSGTRINTERTGEALQTKADTIGVNCPYCLTMFEDGLKDLHSEHTKVTKVKDIAEIVAEGFAEEKIYQ